MITIEEVIISSLYHRLVLVRIKKTPDVTNDEGADVDGGDEKVVQKAKGLGYLSLGGLSKEVISKDKQRSPAYHSIETRSLELVENQVRNKMIRFEDEEVFLKTQIGKMISVGELHVMANRPKVTAEVQTDFEPVWVVNGGGGEVLGGLGQRQLMDGLNMEGVVDLRNCNEFSLARLESLENEEKDGTDAKGEKKSLLIMESKMNSLTESNSNGEVKEECLVKSIVNLRSSMEEHIEKKNKLEMYKGGRKDGKVDGNKEGLVGSYKVFNLSEDGKTLTLEERQDKLADGGVEKRDGGDGGRMVEEGSSIGKDGGRRDERGSVKQECEGIGEVLKPSSYVDFVVHRVEAASYNSNNISNNVDHTQQTQKQVFKDSGVNFSDVKFHRSRDDGLRGRFATMGGGAFKERRRASQRRGRMSRSTVVDGDKFLRHMMTCVGHEKSASDLITITDFKLSPQHAFRSLNSSHADLRQHIDSEFNSPLSSAFSTPVNKPHKSLSERSSPLMMSLPPRTNQSAERTHFASSNDSSVEWNNELMKSFSFYDEPSTKTTTTADSSAITSPMHLLSFEKFPDWMKKLSVKYKRLPLNSIAIPGSHISLAIDRDMKTSMDFSRCNHEMAEFLRKLPNLPVFNHFRNQMKLIWRAWMSKQFLSVYQQLQSGSRYLDMRVGKHNGILLGAHGLFTGHLKRYLKEVRIFLEEQPSEVIVIHLSPTESLEPQDRKHLVTLLFQIFGSKMAAWKGHSRAAAASKRNEFCFPSIQSLLDNHKQLVVVMPTDDVNNHASKHIFGGAVWPDSCLRVATPTSQNIDDLKTSLRHCFASLMSESNNNMTSSNDNMVSLNGGITSSLSDSSNTHKATAATDERSLSSSSSSYPAFKASSSSSSSSSYTTARQWLSSSSSTHTDSSGTFCCDVTTATERCSDRSSTISKFSSSSTEDASTSTTAPVNATTTPALSTIAPSFHAEATPATIATPATTLNIIHAVLSPDMSTVFGKYDGRKSMKELTIIDTSPIVADWLAEKGAGLNVVSVDFIGCPGLVAAILANNEL